MENLERQTKRIFIDETGDKLKIQSYADSDMGCGGGFMGVNPMNNSSFMEVSPGDRCPHCLTTLPTGYMVMVADTESGVVEYESGA